MYLLLLVFLTVSQAFFLPISVPHAGRLSTLQAETSQSGVGVSAFNLAVSNDLSPSSVDEWLSEVDLTAGSYRTLRDRDALLSEYLSLLSRASVINLDPLMMATFDILSGGIMDALVKMEPAGNPITDLIDSVTDVHLEYIEKFCNAIDDGGSDGYSQSSNQEFLAISLQG